MADKRRALGSIVIAACSLGLIVAACKRYRLIPRITSWFRPAESAGSIPSNVKVINSREECLRVVQQLQGDAKDYRVLGFDCEWVTVNGVRRPVALLQLSSNSVYALVRLCHLKAIPAELKELLADPNILKVGVQPEEDAKLLLQDYGAPTKGTVDLRHLAGRVGIVPGGLAKMALNVVGVRLNKNWKIRCSAWDSPQLTYDQMDYAAKDSFVALKIFEAFARRYERLGHDSQDFIALADTYRDTPFRFKNAKGIRGIRQAPQPLKEPLRRNISTRSKPLYENVYMEAPDGELLCTMDRVKAQWYEKKGLATVVCEDPLRMRLTFEPKGRAVGEAGAYDCKEKLNQCVVCGTTDNYSRKFVIPKEYRKFYPVVIKSHSSHDIVLLCANCHRMSNIADNDLREELAIMCKAPLLCHKKKLKVYAVAILKDKNNTADAMTYVKRFYPDQTITEELLVNLSKLDTRPSAKDNVNHAETVTNHFKANAGLLELEKMWREHFLRTMQPRHMPDHWSVAHNENRMKIRAQSGKLDEEDALSVGLVQ